MSSSRPPGGPADVLVALHACDTATDDAIYSGIRANASVIIVRPFPGHHTPLTWTVCAPFFHRERHFGPLEWTGGVVVGPICGHCTALPHTAGCKGTSEIERLSEEKYQSR